MDVTALKRQARSLEQDGKTLEALAIYRQILARIDGTPVLTQELPLYVKTGDLYMKLGDRRNALNMYRRAARHYAVHGSDKSVSALCAKILRVAPGWTHVYLPLVRLMIERGHAASAANVLLSYAESAKLHKAVETLDKLSNLTGEEVKPVLEMVLELAERAERARAKLMERPKGDDEGQRRTTTGPRPGVTDTSPRPALTESGRRPAVTTSAPRPAVAEPAAPIVPGLPATPEAGGEERAVSGADAGFEARDAVTPAPDAMGPPPATPGAEDVSRRTSSTIEVPDLEVTPNPSDARDGLSAEAKVADDGVSKVERQEPPGGEPPGPRESASVGAEPAGTKTQEGRVDGEQQRGPKRPAPARWSGPRPEPRFTIERRRPGTPWWVWVVGVVVALGGVGGLVYAGVIPIPFEVPFLAPAQDSSGAPTSEPAASDAETEPAAEPETAPAPASDASSNASAETEVSTPERPAVTPAESQPAARQPTAVLSSPPVPAATETGRPAGPVPFAPGISTDYPVLAITGLLVESVADLAGGQEGYRLVQVLQSGGRISLTVLTNSDAVNALEEGVVRITNVPGEEPQGMVRVGGSLVTARGVADPDQLAELLTRLVEVSSSG